MLGVALAMVCAMPQQHDLKIDSAFFEDVLFGRKRAEIRRTDDRTFSVGDHLRLWEFKRGKYTKRCLRVEVQHIQPLADVLKHYKSKDLKIPLAVLSLGTRQIVNASPPPLNVAGDAQ